jgi:hypothetical protein
MVIATALNSTKSCPTKAFSNPSKFDNTNLHSWSFAILPVEIKIDFGGAP